MRKKLRSLLFFLCALVLLPQHSRAQQRRAEAETNHWCPADIWRGIDVEKLPLDVQILSSWQDDGRNYQKLTYVSEIADGIPIRIFAIQGLPKQGKRVPGILHIHGGGQTASLPWVEYWVKRGYACVTYDFCGQCKVDRLLFSGVTTTEPPLFSNFRWQSRKAE